MYRIRFHGRGGQGLKTASRILGRALFELDFEVQDAPRYGAERRGAPIFSYVRADQTPIHERGIIHHPDLVIVADDTLMGLPAAACLSGVDEHSTVLLVSNLSAQEWQHRINTKAHLLVLPLADSKVDPAQTSSLGTVCASAAAALLHIIKLDTLRIAVRKELAHLQKNILEENVERAAATFNYVTSHYDTKVTEGKPVLAEMYEKPDWVDLPMETADLSAPTIHGPLTSMQSPTGLWRTIRPVIDYDKCNRCWWICSNFCPDSAINVKDNTPVIDYDHCKGCLICVSQCPPKAIHMEAERSDSPLPEVAL